MKPTNRRTPVFSSGVPTDDELAHRRTLYGRHQPTDPIRATRVPPALADREVFRALAGEREAVRAAELRLAREHSELNARNERARTEHAAAQRRAALSGAAPPPPLSVEPWPHVDHPRALFDDVHRVLEATELGILAEAATTWRSELRADLAPVREQIARAREVLADLERRALPVERALEVVEKLVPRVPAAPAAAMNPRGDRSAAEQAREIEELVAESRRPQRSRFRPR